MTKGITISPEQSVARANQARSRREQTDFANAESGSRWFAYYRHEGYSDPRDIGLVRGDLLTTWMGDKLATIVDSGPIWKSNLGDRRQWIVAWAMVTGGTAEWRGWAYLDAGDYARVRRFA
jgi:hypothetical protein